MESPAAMPTVCCGSRPAGGLLSCRDKKVSKETPTRSLRRLFEPVPCAPRLSRALRNSPESKNDSGSNSARALLRLKLRCSASSDGGEHQNRDLSPIVRFIATEE